MIISRKTKGTGSDSNRWKDGGEMRRWRMKEAEEGEEGERLLLIRYSYS